MIGINILKERYKIIFGYIGEITIGVGFSLFLPLITLFFYKTDKKDIMAIICSGLISLIIGFLLKLNLKSDSDKSLTIQEGGIIVLFSWIIAVILGGLPFIFSGQLSFTQAIFEAVSGFTTTGLSVVNVEETSNMFLLWRSIMQLMGGAGLVVILLSAIIGPHGDNLYNAEARSDRLVPNAKKTVTMIMKIYLSYILSGIILYSIAGMPIFDAINHSIAAVSTGGFSTKADSIGFYNSVSIELITIILMILGTINFASHMLLWKGKFKDFFRIGETRFMLFFMGILIPFVLYFTTLNLFSSLSKSLRVAAFEIISAISTSGFSTVPYTNWNPLGIFTMIILMIIGGGIGSTAGGLKLYRVYTCFKVFIWNIKSVNLPKRVIKENYIIRPEGKFYVSNGHLVEISSFFTIYFFMYIISVTILLAHNYSIFEAMFEMASCFSTVGLSIGVTSPDAPILVLWTQIVGMFFGRLEFFVIFFSIGKIFKDSIFISKN